MTRRACRASRGLAPGTRHGVADSQQAPVHLGAEPHPPALARGDGARVWSTPHGRPRERPITPERCARSAERRVSVAHYRMVNAACQQRLGHLPRLPSRSEPGHPSVSACEMWRRSLGARPARRPAPRTERMNLLEVIRRLSDHRAVLKLLFTKLLGRPRIVRCRASVVHRCQRLEMSQRSQLAVV